MRERIIKPITPIPAIIGWLKARLRNEENAEEEAARVPEEGFFTSIISTPVLPASIFILPIMITLVRAGLLLRRLEAAKAITA